MVGLCTIFPLDWSDPRVRELQATLMTLYRERDIEAVVLAAGLQPAALAWEQSARELWFDAMNEAAGQQRLCELLAAVGERRPALKPRIEELVRAAPVVSAPLPPDAPDVLSPTDPRWKNFTAGNRERQIVEGQPTLLDIVFLEHGLDRARAVCRLEVAMGGNLYHGTAFRVGPRMLLTNHHVLYDWDHDETPATWAQAAFGYEIDLRGQLRKATLVDCDVASIRGERAHDFAVIAAADGLPDDIPVLSLHTGASVEADDRVYIIQHPKGLPKKIGMHHNLVRYADADVVQYWTDTEKGSSGSPVFDDDWRVVALHHQEVDAPLSDGLAYRNQGRTITRVAQRIASLGIDLDLM
jgi:V8-like Glu-specific endopeptidase